MPLVRPLALTSRAKPERWAQPVVKAPERRRGKAAPQIRRRSRNEIARPIPRPMLVFQIVSHTSWSKIDKGKSDEEIITGSNGEATRARYLGIFSDVKLFEGDFGQFVDQKGGGIL